MTPVHRFLALVLVALLAAACGDNRGTAGSSGRPGPSTTSVEPTDAAYYSPLNHWASGDGNTSATEQKFEADMTACMSSKGWTFQGYGVLQPSDPSRLGDLRAYRHTVGYGIAQRSFDPRYLAASAAEKATLGTLPPDKARQYTNARSECQAQSDAALHAGLPFYDPAVRNDYASALQTVFSDPAFTRAVSSWARCMGSKGYSVHQLDDPRNEVESRVLSASQARDPDALTHVSSYEVPIASADIDCQGDSVIPARQVLENAQLLALKAKFPQYATR